MMLGPGAVSRWESINVTNSQHQDYGSFDAQTHVPMRPYPALGQTRSHCWSACSSQMTHGCGDGSGGNLRGELSSESTFASSSPRGALRKAPVGHAQQARERKRTSTTFRTYCSSESPSTASSGNVASERKCAAISANNSTRASGSKSSRRSSA